MISIRSGRVIYLKYAIEPTMIRTAMIINAGIHSGHSIHSHGHVMYPVNFRPMNRTVNNPTNPTPPDDDELELLISLSSSYYVILIPLIPTLSGALVSPPALHRVGVHHLSAFAAFVIFCGCHISF